MPESPVRVRRTDFTPYEVFRDRLDLVGADDAETAAPELVYLPGGTFEMGDEQGHDDEKPVHPVRLSAFALGRTPVTWGQYQVFCEATGAHWPEWLEPGNAYHVQTGTDDHYAKRGIAPDALDFPVVGIRWDDARAYCDWLSERTGERYALPTEAQWEYACRAGTRTRWSCGDDPAALSDYAWFSGNSGSRLHAVAGRRPNPWGLHDMHGNCWEWCADWYARDYYRALAERLRVGSAIGEQIARGRDRRSSGWQRLATMLGFGASSAATGSSGEQQIASEEPSGPESNHLRVARGGACNLGANFCRSACRNHRRPSDRRVILGFRLSRTV